MKNHIIILIIVFSLIIFPVINLIPQTTIIPICFAAEKITPYKPEVRYIKPQSMLKEPQQKAEIKSKRKIWPWVIGGVVLIGVAVAIAGGGGGGDSGGSPSTNGEGDNNPPTNDEPVDVDVTW